MRIDGPQISRLLKVDRVRSAEEAVAVERLGAGMVGVTLSPDPRFDDDRTLTVEQAALVGKALRQATLVAVTEVADEPEPILRMAAATGAGLVQPIRSNTVPPPGVRTALSDAGIGIVYSGIEIAHDDDASWIFSAFTDKPDTGAVLFQVDVLPEYDGSWAFLRDQSPEYPEEFQIDLDMLGREYPLVVGPDFTPDNLNEIIDALPAVRGIAFTLAERARRDDLHFHSYADVIRILGGV